MSDRENILVLTNTGLPLRLTYDRQRQEFAASLYSKPRPEARKIGIKTGSSIAFVVASAGVMPRPTVEDLPHLPRAHSLWLGYANFDISEAAHTKIVTWLAELKQERERATATAGSAVQ